MSKRIYCDSGLFTRSAATMLTICIFVSPVASPSHAQEGFSIFEPAESADEEPTVSPQEAFTNPQVKLPKSQFGSFKQTKSVEREPKMTGSKAIGNYARDGRSMFNQSPDSVDADSGKLAPIGTNSLRTSRQPKPDPATSDSAAAPIVVSEDEKPARRLPPLPIKPSTDEPSEAPEVAQVAFQEGGFSTFDRGQNTSNRFGQPSPTRNRFNSDSAQSPLGMTPPGQPVASRPITPTSPLRNAPAERRPMIRANSGFPGSGTSTRPAAAPVARTAAIPEPLRTMGSTPLTATKPAPQSARELLSSWATNVDAAKLPGKPVKLHELLAQPINGQRKDVINQYWVTFSDMVSHKLAVEQAQWLNSITNLRQPADQAVLKAAQQAADNRVLHTEIQLAKSQAILGDYLPGLRYKNGKNIPVLPADVPWVGKLNTKLKEYQRRGIVPNRFNAIDDVLPKARKLIANQADAVVASSRAAEQAKVAMMSGQAPVANVLEAVRIQERNQKELLATVGGYNRAITDYVLSVRHDILQPKRLASVLIGRSSVQPKVAVSSVLEKANAAAKSAATAPVRSVSSTKSPRQTLPGKSAYQNQDSAIATESLSSPLSPASTAQNDKTTPTFEYGPTAESAKAANFDPAKVTAELPMKKAQPKASSSGYESNTARNATRPPRSISTSPVRQVGQNLGQSGRRPVEQRSAMAPQNPNANTGGTRPGSRFTPSAPIRNGGNTFAPNESATPTIPKAENTGSRPSPFSSTSSSSVPKVTSQADRASSAFGGSTFGNGGVQKPASTSSRFGSPGFGSSNKQ